MSLLSANIKFAWVKCEQTSFDTIKKPVSDILTHPNFTQAFDTHADASDVQLEALISQNEKPPAFFCISSSQRQRRHPPDLWPTPLPATPLWAASSGIFEA